MRFLLFLFPWLELFLLIQLGVSTSAGMALLYVLLTFVLGLALLQRQGLGMLRQLGEGGALNPQLLMDDMAMGLAGLLLLIPGLITDFAALLVLSGPLRRMLLYKLQGEPPVQRSQRETSHRPEVIEGEFRRVDDPENQ